MLRLLGRVVGMLEASVRSEHWPIHFVYMCHKCGDRMHASLTQASEMAPRPMELAERVSIIVALAALLHELIQSYCAHVRIVQHSCRSQHQYIHTLTHTHAKALAGALALRPNTEEDGTAWLSVDEVEGGAVVRVTEREDIPLALDQHERRMPWGRRCVRGCRFVGVVVVGTMGWFGGWPTVASMRSFFFSSSFAFQKTRTPVAMRCTQTTFQPPSTPTPTHPHAPYDDSFRAALHQSLQYVEPELLGCPPALVLAVASTNEAPVHCFEELGAVGGRHWPALFRNGQCNPQARNERRGKHEREGKLLSTLSPPKSTTGCGQGAGAGARRGGGQTAGNRAGRRGAEADEGGLPHGALQVSAVYMLLRHLHFAEIDERTHSLSDLSISHALSKRTHTPKGSSASTRSRRRRPTCSRPTSGRTRSPSPRPAPASSRTRTARGCGESVCARCA